MNLFIGNSNEENKVHNIFRLFGSDEDALTYALGYLFSENTDFLISFLKNAQVLKSQKGKNYRKQFSDYKVILQDHAKGLTGRRDIVVECGDMLRVIIEAKIGAGIPGHQQIKKYSLENLELWEKFKKKSIITLTKRKFDIRQEYSILVNEIKKQGLDISIHSLLWGAISEMIIRSNDESLKPLLNTIKEDYGMEYFDYEILYVHTIKGKTYDLAVQHPKGYYFTSRKIKDALFFLPCWGAAHQSLKTGKVIRRIDKKTVIRSGDLQNLSDTDPLKKAFIKHIVWFPVDKDKEKLINVFILGNSIPIPDKNQKFNGGKNGPKKIDAILI